jgi:hypothetical protein
MSRECREQAFTALQHFFRFGLRAKLLHCSKNEARVSCTLKSGPKFSFKIG